MTTYAKVTIMQYLDSPEELDLNDYIARHGEPVDHLTVRLYIVDELPSMDKPEVSVLGWFVGKFYYSQVKQMHLQPAYGSGHGNYEVSGQRVRMTQPNAKSVYHITRQVPRPKCRFETEWRYGRWWKYLKTKGWVPA